MNTVLAFGVRCSVFERSIGETRAQLVYALDFGYLKQETFSDLDELGRTTSQCLRGLIRYVNDTNFRGRKFKKRDEVADNIGLDSRPRGAPAA
jgi:hypothetical protein